MFVEFSVTNYRSFAEKQTLSLVAGGSAKKQPCFAFTSGNSFAPDLLRSACIFGANGSGKTALVKAMDFFKDFVISSSKNSQEGEPIGVEPNVFRTGLAERPSTFEIVFVHQETLYQYGFAVDQQRVWSEWLFARPNKDKSRTRGLFQREFDATEQNYSWDINHTHIKGQKELWKKSTRDNSLFLSQAVQLNAEDLKTPFSWIQDNFGVIKSANGLPYNFTARQCDGKDKKTEILELLQSVDIRIQDINIEKKEVNFNLSSIPFVDKVFPKEFLENFRKEKFPKLEIKLSHQQESGSLIPLHIDEESKGTQVLFGLAGLWLEVLERGYTLVIDELHNHMHPHALRILINLFHNPVINKNRAQLIFTSHETSVMAKGFMHQDQIWLTEKSTYESTRLVPLSDFKVRDLHNFQKAYLHGRYGGVPNIRETLFHGK